jgi:hypothetical protein
MDVKCNKGKSMNIPAHVQAKGKGLEPQNSIPNNPESDTLILDPQLTSVLRRIAKDQGKTDDQMLYRMVGLLSTMWGMKKKGYHPHMVNEKGEMIAHFIL